MAGTTSSIGTDVADAAGFHPLVVERAHDLITILDLDGVITFASPSWADLGHVPADLCGRSILDLVHPDDTGHAAAAMAAVAEEQSIEVIPVRLRRADGTYAMIETTGTLLHDGDGNPSGFLGTARDVTDREELRARAAELAVVNRIADAVVRASSIDELLDEAAEAIVAGLGASRASVLLADGEGVMRFRAWRGLSESYRAATEGHSPWPADAVDPQPVLVPDVLGADFQPALTATVLGEGIRALAFVPLVHGDRLLGKFMVYFDGPHEFTEHEIRLCRTVANHLASSAARFAAHDDLGQSLALVDAIFETAPMGLAYWDAALRYVRINDALVAINGIPRDEIVGRHVFEVFPAFEADLGEPMRRVIEDGEPTLDLEITAHTPASQTPRDFRVSFYPVRDSADEIVGAGGVIVDVTEERAARLAAEERAHVAAAIEFVDDAVFLVDHDGVVRVWNPAAARILGVSGPDAVGRPIEDVVARWELFGSSAQPTRTLPFDVRGEERWLSLTSAPYPGGTVYAAHDVTEQQRVERAKTDFIATVSHELRTPLAAVYGAAVTLRRPDLELPDDGRTRFLDMIVAETDRLARIVNDILWASRLESGPLAVEAETVDVGRLAAEVVDAARAYAPASVELSVDANGGALARSDSDKLRQVLTNLVQNAIKYSPEGGPVTVSVHSGERVRVAVSDNGLGIPPSEQERIWDKFVRLDPDLSRGVGGTGLGLYICRELVALLGGRIWVESDGTTGSTFLVELPAVS